MQNEEYFFLCDLYWPFTDIKAMKPSEIRSYMKDGKQRNALRIVIGTPIRKLLFVRQNMIKINVTEIRSKHLEVNESGSRVCLLGGGGRY